MGQKVHPYGFRVGTLYGWQSNWFAEKNYAQRADHQLVAAFETVTHRDQERSSLVTSLFLVNRRKYSIKQVVSFSNRSSGFDRDLGMRLFHWSIRQL